MGQEGGALGVSASFQLRGHHMIGLTAPNASLFI